MPFSKWFEQLSRQDVPIAGGKGANLGEMVQAGLPVPPGFVVTVDAYGTFIAESGIAGQIEAKLSHVDVDDPAQLRTVAGEIQQLICRAAVPETVRTEVIRAYDELAHRIGVERPYVAVRSSATVEDTAQFSFAGMFQSFLNVRGPDELIDSLKGCWASAFGGRVLFYREKQGLPRKGLLAVIVQKMVNADKSGVLFTVDPATRNTDVLVIEAAWGLGEVVVGGEIEPDRYIVDKKTLRVVERSIGHKAFKIVRGERGGNVCIDLPPEQADAPVLTEHEIRTLAELGLRDEQHYGAPQDAEIAIEGSQIFIVQTRPVTTLGLPEAAAGRPPERAGAAPILRGLGASPGVATGRVKVLASPQEEGKLAPGEILVTTMTSPDWVPIMRRAAAIVTDGGGMTSHAAIVSRELGIPCIVGTRKATQVLKDGVEITVNATEGAVYPGRAGRPAPREAAASAAPTVVAAPPLVTATKLYVNLAEPERLEEVARQPIDGVGLLRAEFMIVDALEGIHPRRFIEEGKSGQFVDRMAQSLSRFAQAFRPRPVIYRSMDFKSNEFRDLKGGEQYEPQEANPMIGYRGCYRYVKEPDLFKLELQAIKRVREDFSNLHLMIPFVRTGWEFRACKRLVDASGLTDRSDFHLWVMAEVPSIVSWLPDYVEAGVTGVSIGSNDLTQLVLGVDRDSTVVAPLFDERDRAVLDTIRTIIRECQRLGITCSICGQAPSVYPDYAEILVRWGIDSISVNPDVVDVTRRHIAAAEQRLLLEEARSRQSAA